MTEDQTKHDAEEKAARNLRWSWRIGVTGILVVLCLVAALAIWLSLNVAGWTP